MAVNLQDFKYDEYAEVAVECLNEMVTNALSHTVDCLQYMAALQEMTNLRFCAMPQVRKRTCLNAQFPGYVI
jgi:farnesyl-diphosphate farnesyltransferase